MENDFGYIVVSHHVIRQKRPIGYIFREEPENEADSGWRIYSGQESPNYADNPGNFSMFDAAKIIELDPAVEALLNEPYPVEFARYEEDGDFVEVDEN